MSSTEITLKSTIDVEYIDHMGSDERIVEAMLVSTKGLDAKEAAKESIRGRLNYLMKNRHGTPFECGAMTVRVHAPIKVWREWHRHRVGFSYNEQSGRYTPFAPVFWLPPIERAMIEPVHFKSSSPVFITPTDDQYASITYHLKRGYSDAFERYEELLGMGVDKGLARDVLGVGIFSACYVTANPRSFMHFMELRTNRPDAKRPSKPLWEIDNAAQQLEAIFKTVWPITHELWCQHGRQAP